MCAPLKSHSARWPPTWVPGLLFFCVQDGPAYRCFRFIAPLHPSSAARKQFSNLWWAVEGGGSLWKALVGCALMSAKVYIRLGVPLGQAARRATGSVSKFVLAGGRRAED